MSSDREAVTEEILYQQLATAHERAEAGLRLLEIAETLAGLGEERREEALKLVRSAEIGIAGLQGRGEKGLGIDPNSLSGKLGPLCEDLADLGLLVPTEDPESEGLLVTGDRESIIESISL